MTEKRDTDLILDTNQSKVMMTNQFIVTPLSVVPDSLTTSVKQMENGVFFPDQGGYKPHPVWGIHSSTYCSTYLVFTGVPESLLSGQPFC